MPLVERGRERPKLCVAQMSRIDAAFHSKKLLCERGLCGVMSAIVTLNLIDSPTGQKPTHTAVSAEIMTRRLLK